MFFAWLYYFEVNNRVYSLIVHFNTIRLKNGITGLVQVTTIFYSIPTEIPTHTSIE